ncbi:MAG: transglycosylase SLT domain-containing protein [Synergistaceae bacterium]|nr:transglycosylase SLT domain-containing protein [Synergistaceae bacterium]
MTKKLFTSLLLLVTLSSSTSTSWAASLNDLFWQHSWQEMEAVFNSQKKHSQQDYSLMANAYRFQGKWSECAGILEAHSKNFPAQIRPYAEMTLLLAYENLHDNRKALALSETLYRNAPADLKYYAALSQFRLYEGMNDSGNALNVLNRMLNHADTDERKIYTLSKLVKTPGNKNVNAHALKLLELQPADKSAAEVLARVKNPDNNMKVALGVYYHSTGNNKAALEVLRHASGRKANYYKAWANSRLKNNNEALNIWGNLVVTGNSYSASSVTRIANLAKDKGMHNSCVNVLQRIARDRRGNAQARALQALINLTGEENKKVYEGKILKSFPNTNYSFNVLWSRAWESLNSGNAAEAVRLFRQADAPGITYYRRARVLYWLAQAQARAGHRKDSENTLALLKRKYPLTIYGLISNAPVKIIDGMNPNLTLKPSELESWGYVYHAYLKLSRPKASTRELYRALMLSRWLGLEESYSEARRLETLMTSGTNLYRADLEALYPRPFKNLVDSAGKLYGVETNFIWAIMRQESAFRPAARSWVGAAGLMQLMPATAKEEAKRAGLAHYDLNNPSDNIRLGASHLGWLGKNFAKKEYIMAAYNAGSGNARKWLKSAGENADLAHWIEAVKFTETNGYVQRVSANLEIYRMLYKDAR